MERRIEPESLRPLVLRHAYQSETRRYTPRRPERTLLYRTVGENLETLLRTAREQNESGQGLPKYVEQEFREYLRCGIPCHGFTRLACQACGRAIFLSFSCKRRGCCSSCAARRMCNTAAVVIDRVFPDIPVRQWVLSTPFEMRLLLARDAVAFGELTRIFMEEVLARYRCNAVKLGLSDAEGGALVFQHRFGGSLNLNTHLHAVAADGVFERTTASDGAQRAMFHSLPSLEPLELIAVAFNVYRRFAEWLKKKGLIRLADADESYEKEDPLASFLRGSIGIGKIAELTDDGDIEFTEEDMDAKRFALRRSPHVGEFGGFSIHASVTVNADDRDGRERLIRYCARPAVSMERLSETREGLIAYRLRHVQKGRATHRVMTPVEFLARIAAIIPPPRHPLLRYFGVFGPNSSWRKLCVPQAIEVGCGGQSLPPTTSEQAKSPTSDGFPEGTSSKVHGENAVLLPEQNAGTCDHVQQMGLSSAKATSTRVSRCVINPWRLDWATLLKRTYDVDVMVCPCGGRLKAVELVTEAVRAKQLLEKFGMPAYSPPVARARSPDWD